MSSAFDIAPFLDDLPDVQGGSIVSKKLLVDNGRRVIGFAFGAGQELTEHTTPLNARIYTVSGLLNVSVAGVPSVAGAGESVDLPGGIPHSVHAVEDSRVVLVMGL